MKLAAIFNVWGDSIELLDGAIKNVKDHIDVLIIVYQDVSNFGETYFCGPELQHLKDNGAILVKFDPRLELGGSINETNKRNLGLITARNSGCDHFLFMDCDEYYVDFAEGKKLFMESGHNGSVCKLHTYFKSPTLRFDKPEDYWVPFIHKLLPKTKAGMHFSYPFWSDPTRRVNEEDVIELPIFMHHYSWCRKNIDMKVRNSSATGLIANRGILNDYYSPNLKPGFYLESYQRTLVPVVDTFGISKMIS